VPAYRRLSTYLRILAISIGAALVGFLISLFVPKQYSSYATLYFPMDQSKGQNALSALAGASLPEEGGTVLNLNGALVNPAVAAAPRTAFGLLRSRECRLRVTQDLKLEQRWGLSLDKTLERLAESMNIRTDENNFLKCEATVGDPELARDIVDSHYRALVAMSDDLQFNVSKTNREYVAKLLSQKRQEVDRKERNLAEEYVAAGPADRDLLIKNYLETRAKLAAVQVNSKANAASLARIESSLMSLYRQAKTSPGAAAAVEELAATIQSRLVELSSTKAKFTSASAEVQDAEKALKAAMSVAGTVAGERQRLLKQRVDPAVGQLSGQLAGLSASAQEYVRQLSVLRKELERQPSQMIRIEALQRDLATASKAMAQLETELQTAMIAESRDPAKFELVDKPFLPQDPVFPRKGLFVGVAFIFTAFVLLLPQLNQALKSAESET